MYCNMVLVYKLFLLYLPPAPCARAHVSIAKKIKLFFVLMCTQA